MSKVTVILLLILSITTGNAFAQSSASAHQTVVLQLNPIIQFSNVANPNGANKPGSNNSEFKVASNANYIVSVKTVSADDKQLGIAVNGNNNYASVSAKRQDVIVNGKEGTQQTFAINYKSTKASHKSSQDVAVVYTATEP